MSPEIMRVRKSEFAKHKNCSQLMVHLFTNIANENNPCENACSNCEYCISE